MAITREMTVMSTQTRDNTRNESALRRLGKETGGNFAVMTALLMPVCIMAAGVAVDFSTAVNVRTDLQSVVDSAALAGVAVYDGTNAAEAEAVARKLLAAARDHIPANVAYTVTPGTDSVTLNVTAQGTTEASLMRIANVTTFPVSAGSTALRPRKPEAATFTADHAQGWYYKLITVRVVRPGSTAEEVISTIEYQPTDHNKGGTMTVSPGGTIELGDYTKLVLQMDIKNDGCPVGKRNPSPSAVKVNCNEISTRDAKNYPSSFKYDNVLRTDNPATSGNLFINGAQRATGRALDYTELLDCSGTQKHSWEDQTTVSLTDTRDFFYTVTAKCVFDDGSLRLIN